MIGPYLFLACSSPPPTEGFTGTFTDAEGRDWVIDDPEVMRTRFEASTCRSATWYQVWGGGSFFAWFGVPDSGGFESSRLQVSWGSDDVHQAQSIQGAEGEQIPGDPDVFEYHFTRAQQCTLPIQVTGSEEFICADMVGTAILVVEGDLDGPFDAAPDVEVGEPWGEDPATGDAICGGEPPGT